MANIASLFKAEITRLARKELRTQAESLRKSVARYRGDIAVLKRQNAELSRRVVRLEKLLARGGPAQSAAAAEVKDKVRYRADSLKKLRERHGLSAPMLAGILGVSAQTIYNWEAKTSRPGKDHLARIAVLRKMGKREFQARMAQSRT